MGSEITPEMCIGGRELTEPKLDPRGRRLAFVARTGEAAIVLVDLDDDATVERHVTTVPSPSPGRGLDGGCWAWTPEGDAIVYAAGDGGLWRQPVPGGPLEQLAGGDPERRVQAPVVAPGGTFVAFVVDQAEVWIHPLAGGAPRRIDDGRHDFCLDPAIDPTSRRVTYQAWSVPDMAWDGAVAVTVDVETGARTVTGPPDGAVQQPQYAPDGTLVSVHDGGGWLNVWWGDRPLVAGGEPFEHAEPTWGPGQASYAVAPDGRRVAFARNERGFGRLCVADVATGAVTEVARGVHGQLTWCGARLAALRTGARTPTQVVVYDTATWHRGTVAVGPVLAWDTVDLPEPEPLTVDDGGVTLHARHYRARQPAGRLLCWIHGGPTGQWTVEFMPRLAYWLDRGWDVLVPDHRGSTGHGRAYQQALRGLWGELDVEDTTAVLAHVQAATGIPPSRTVAVGGSAGGMTVLGLLARHGDLVAGGIASYPVTDLVELAAKSHRFEAHYTDTLVAPATQADVLRDRSPIAAAARVSGPLLLLHGTADPVVPVAGTVAYAEAVRVSGGDVELHLFDGEGHGFRRLETQLREYALMEQFLGRVVG